MISGNSMNLDLRPSPIAGLWYEGDPKVLARTIDGYLDHAQLPNLEGEVIAVVAPHAGHRYSGSVAGSAFAALRGLKPDLVAIFEYFTDSHKGARLRRMGGRFPVDTEARLLAPPRDPER